MALPDTHPKLPDGRPALTKEMNPNTGREGWHVKSIGRPSTTFLKWFRRNEDDLFEFGLAGFLFGCGVITLAIGILFAWGLFKLIQYYFY